MAYNPYDLRRNAAAQQSQTRKKVWEEQAPEVLKQAQQIQQETKRQRVLDLLAQNMNTGAPSVQDQREMRLTEAVRLEDQAKQNYEAYKASDQRDEDWKKTFHEAVMGINWGSGNADLQIEQLPQKTINQTEAQHEAVANYFEQNRKATQDLNTMEKDLEEVGRMDEADRKLLETYAYGRNEWFDHQKIADSVSAWAELEKKYGKQKVEELAESWQRYQNAMSAQRTRQEAQEAGDGFGAKVAHSAASVAANAVNNLSAPLGYLQEAFGRTGRYQTLDPNNAGNMAGVYASAAREAVAEDMGTVGKVLYQGTMGALDNAARIGMGGRTAVGSLGLAALGSFGSTVSEASAQGATPGQAVAKGILSAGIEVATEKVPLDELFKAGKGGYQGAKAAFKQALKQGGIEAAEEEISLLGNVLVDALVMREKSSYNQQIGELVANGMSYRDAKAQADRALWDEAVNTALTSFVSGGFMSGAQSTGQYVGQQLAERQQMRNELSGQIQDMMQKESTGAENAPVETARRDTLKEAANELLGVQTQKNTASKDAVKVVSSGKSAINESNREKATLAYTLATNIEAVRDMEPVTKLSGNEISDKGVQLSDQIRNFFKKVGNKVFRNGFGDVELGEYGVGGVLNHKPLNRAKVLSLAAVPDVIQNGRQIGYDPNWKGRGYESFIFAAPVNVAGTDVYVAAVVNRLPDNKFYLSEMVDSQGNYVRIEKSPSGSSKNELPMGPGNQQGRDYAGPEELSEEGNPSTYAEPMSSSANIIPKKRENVNGQNAPQGAPEGFEAMGAASWNFTGKEGYYNALYEGNIQRQRKGDAREIEVPIKDTQGKNVSEFVGNSMNSAVTPETFTDAIQELISEGSLSHDVQTNEQTLAKAANEIAKDGSIYESVQKVKEVAQSGKTSAEDIAKAKLLYEHLTREIDRQIEGRGEADENTQGLAKDVYISLAQMATNSGRSMQIYNLFRKMTPEYQAKVLVEEIGREVGQLQKQGKVKKDYEIQVDDQLLQDYTKAAEEYQKADNEEAKKEAERKMHDIQEAIYLAEAAKLPSTFKAKWDAWRYMAMLGNLKTQARNVGGNVMFMPYVGIKDLISKAAEAVLIGDKRNRTKSFLGVSKSDRALKAWAKADAKSEGMKNVLKGSAKIGDDTGKSRLADNMKVFDSKILETARTAVNGAVEWGDMLFKSPYYTGALAGFIKSRGYTAADIAEGRVSDDLLDEARAYAVSEAMKATFNDSNAFSDFMANDLRYKGENPIGKAVNALAEGVIPFRKTPANIVVRTVGYSPVGLAKGLWNAAANVKNGKVSAATAIDQIASGVTGSLAMGFGWMLANGVFGVRLRGSEVDEEEREEGHQPYSLEFYIDGKLYSYKIDWCAPANLPLFIGANIRDMTANSTEDTSLTKFTKFVYALGTAFEPMLSLSCMSSLNDLVEGAKYAGDGEALYTIAVSAATSYLTQGIPALLRQTEQAAQENERQTYANSEDPLIRSAQRTAGKIPFVGETLGLKVDRIDDEGQSVSRGTLPERVFNAFVNPGTLKEIETDAVDEEKRRLSQVQDENVQPPDIPKTITYTASDGNRHENYRLTAQEYEDYSRVQGQAQQRILDEMIQGMDYAALTDAQKAKAVSLAYDYARELARGEVLPGYDGMDAWMQGAQGKEAAAIVQQVAEKAIAGSFDDLTEAWKNSGDDAAAREALEAAYSTFKNLSTVTQNAITEEATGREKDFLAARAAGVSTSTFADLYKKFRDISNDDALKAGQKANQWAAALQRAVEQRLITPSQRNILKENMKISFGSTMDAEKYDGMTAAGLKANEADDLMWLLEGLEIQEGYAEVRDVQKWDAIANTSFMSEQEKDAVMKLYMPDYDPTDRNPNKTELKYDYAREVFGLSPEEYVEAYRAHTDNSTKGEKMAEWQAMGFSSAEAYMLYRLFSATGKNKIDVVEWFNAQ